MKDPQIWMTLWESTVGVGCEIGGGRSKGENWDNCSRIPTKNDV